MTAQTVTRQSIATHERAVQLLRAVDPVAAELYQLGYRAGIEEGERRAATRAEVQAEHFLYELGNLPEVPPLDTPTTRSAAA